MTTSNREFTGHRGVDELIRIARTRGLNVNIDDYRGDWSFVVVTIDNKGMAGENRLNEDRVSLYLSFRRSARGRFGGGYRSPMLGKMRKYAKSGKGLFDAGTAVRSFLWIAPEHRNEYERSQYVERERALAGGDPVFDA